MLGPSTAGVNHLNQGKDGDFWLPATGFCLRAEAWESGREGRFGAPPKALAEGVPTLAPHCGWPYRPSGTSSRMTPSPLFSRKT
jgi:hypothetical protein